MKKREKSGVVFYGVSVKSSVRSASRDLGYVIDVETINLVDIKEKIFIDEGELERLNKEANTSGSKIEKTHETRRISIYPIMWTSINGNMYDRYVKQLTRKSSTKKLINKYFKENFKETAESLFAKYIDSKKIKTTSDLFRHTKLQRFGKNINDIFKHGLFPIYYKQAGSSPRIDPNGYGSSVNSINKEIRKYIYEVMADSIRDQGKIILDLDLKSCYTCILVGLFPDKMYYIGKALEKAIWNSLKEEFINQNKEEAFYKAYVKICFYASLFGGGGRAMINGVLDTESKNHGMIEKQFRDNDNEI